MSFSVPQSSLTAVTVSATSTTFQYPSSVTAGNLLVCGVSIITGGLAQTVTVTDDVNGSWQLISQSHEDFTTNLDIYMFYFANTGAGRPTLTFTSTRSTVFYIHIAEVAGAQTVNPLDGYGVGSMANGATAAIVPFTTTRADFVYCNVLPFNTISSSTGWTQLQFDAANGTYSFYQVQSVAGLESASFGLSGATQWWVISAAAFKPQSPPVTNTVPSGSALSTPAFSAKFLFFDTGDYSTGL